MYFLQEFSLSCDNMHKMHLICENNTLDASKKDDYTKFQISFIRFFDYKI